MDKTTYERLLKEVNEQEFSANEQSIYDYQIFYQEERLHHSTEEKRFEEDEIDEAVIEGNGDMTLMMEIEDVQKKKSCGRSCKIMCCRRDIIP